MNHLDPLVKSSRVESDGEFDGDDDDDDDDDLAGLEKSDGKNERNIEAKVSSTDDTNEEKQITKYFETRRTTKTNIIDEQRVAGSRQ